MDFTQIFNQMAFPLASCIAMGWYVYHTNEQHREDMHENNRQHSEAEKNMMEALNNNTLALTRLCDRLEGSVKGIMEQEG